MTIMSHLREIADHTFENVTKQILESGQRLIPAIISLDRDGGHHLTFVDFETDAGKFAAYDTVCRRLWNQGMLGVITLNDTWVSTRAWPLPPGYTRPRDDPDRSEAITIALKTREGEKEVWLVPYHREGKKIIWQTRQVFKEADVHLLEAFRPPTPDEELLFKRGRKR